MKYIKYFELGPTKKPVLFSSKHFNIQGEGRKIYKSETTSSFAIFGLIEIIRDYPEYINNEELRKIPISLGEVYFANDNLELSPEKIKNIEKYRSGEIGDFISDSRKKLEIIPAEVYMDLTFKYYPMIEDAIKNSKNYGELMDKYEVIRKNILKDSEIFMATNKYNL